FHHSHRSTRCALSACVASVCLSSRSSSYYWPPGHRDLHSFPTRRYSDLTFRNSRDERALPVRRLGSFLPGSGRGGAGTHWNGQTDRYMAYDFEIKSMTEERYGKEKLAEDSGLRYRDWGITFDEMEKYYDKYEKTAGVSGEENPLGEKRSNQ